jgi:excinuclease ABC subunit C
MAEHGVHDIPMAGRRQGRRPRPGQGGVLAPWAAAPFALPHNDPVLYFVQRLRDEAHRFAIGTHRAKRAKTSSPTPSTRSRAWAPRASARSSSHFGSAKAVSPRGARRPQGVPGVSDQLAEAIYGILPREGMKRFTTLR